MIIASAETIIESILRKRDSEGNYIASLLEAFPEIDYRKDDRWIDAIYGLGRAFPNVKFEEYDIRRLDQKVEKADGYEKRMTRIEQDITLQSRGGRTVTNEERAELVGSKNMIDIYESEAREAFAAFFSVCEGLNRAAEGEDIDLEEEVFSKMYDYRFELSSKNPVVRKYYESYKTYRNELARAEGEKEELRSKNDQLTFKLNLLQNTNDSLNQQVSALQEMLNKALSFCNRIKSRRKGILGRFIRKHKSRDLDALSNYEQMI